MQCYRSFSSFNPLRKIFELYVSNHFNILQEAAEAYLTCLFEDANLAAIHAGRVTLFVSLSFTFDAKLMLTSY